MLTALPGWVVDDVTSVREEVKEWTDTTPAERWKLALLSSRDAMWAVGASGKREQVLEQIDPMPPSTVAALTRLREEAGWGCGAG